MKYELKNTDLADIEELKSDCNHVYFNMVRNQHFNIGDILIKKEITIDPDTGKVEKEEIERYNESAVPQRYLVVHEENGIFFIKDIGLNGKLSPGVTSTINEQPDWDMLYVYEVDPSAVESQIIGEEFDVGAILKEEMDRRDSIIETNKKSSKRLVTLKDANDYIYSLTANKKFYHHESSIQAFRNSIWYDKVFGRRTKKMKLSEFKKTQRWALRYRWTGGPEKSVLNEKFVYYWKSTNGSLHTSIDLLDHVVYDNEPISVSRTL